MLCSTIIPVSPEAERDETDGLVASPSKDSGHAECEARMQCQCDLYPGVEVVATVSAAVTAAVVPGVWLRDALGYQLPRYCLLAFLSFFPLFIFYVYVYGCVYCV